MQVSLQALKAFESAARLGSFKLAAEELSLTPTAISHHIGNLENRLNVSLFHRQGRRICLTGTGSRLARATSEGFRRIDSALEEVMKAGSGVRVTTTSSLAAMALIPSQHEFEQANPDISVEISTGESVENQPYTIPIRLGDASTVQAGDVVKYESFNVFGAYGKAPPAWANETITVFTTEWKNRSLPDPPFGAWLKKNELDGADIRLKKFDQELFGIQQALAENGLVFCSTTLAARLSKTKLLQQFETQPVASNLCYYVPNKNSFETRGAVRFLEWIEDILNL
ncbi:Transcriptional regulator, LysR family [Marinobacter nauticus ATCC 49840]|uniref:LysR family transcriptional regulator n=1 Tax=Marinobacter nauticus TaxID=2743 RepID=UPI000256E9F1|nr:LysR family transcriptional regulator [Marinobacter nauticus]MAL33548.1 LysR family transcriptional regulator [Marinobacter sp.]MCG8522621.1 LysR family transcriptional regulator [Pseudomonadales bacterium]CCG95426.1 Transcriptional regulator, LysR family [Marinobacter nauticus ATCC 49840]